MLADWFDTAAFVNIFTSYFVIIDPIGVALIFYSLTQTNPRAEQIRIANRSLLIAMGILFCFALFGEWLLLKLGISMEAVKISGGLLLFYTAFNMISQPESYFKQSGVTGDISVYPMAIPFIAGPATLTLTVLVSSDSHTVAQWTAFAVAALSVYAITWLCFVYASSIIRFMGKTGDNILRRLLGVLLASLAIQFVADGAKTLF